MRYEDLTLDMLVTKRQRPMYLSFFTKMRQDLSMSDYPKDPHSYRRFFIDRMNTWVRAHESVRYDGLDSMPIIDAILGTTHQLDELHMLHGSTICTFAGEYKYHRRLTSNTVKQVKSAKDITSSDVMIVSYPSCITTGEIDEFDLILDRCAELEVPVHIDGAWFGQCRNVSLDVSHPAIKTVSVSLSKAFGMGSQRIGIRYSKERTVGPVSIMNDFEYANVSDMWIGVNMMDAFGPDYWWKNYSNLYSKVCTDFNLEEADSIHVAWKVLNGHRVQLGIRTPLRMLIDGIYDERGTDAGLNAIERGERI
jgi:hypothetical protein